MIDLHDKHLINRAGKGDSRMQDAANSDLMAMTVEVVAAYVGANNLDAGDLPGLVQSVHGTLKSLAQGVEAPAAPVRDLTPAVPIKKSIFPDYIVCLEDGKKFKSLKRHLRSAYDMSPEEYRAKWGLPADYPMVPPNYAAARSELAKKIGLGRGRRA
jgi:predicted transcriptional regulator